ncbi:MAG: polysaccharide pyruvyl transferase CsaB [Eubacteriales bacterium]
MKVLHLISGGDTGGAKTHVFALLGKLKERADVKIVCFMKGVFWDELQAVGVDCELILQKSRFDMSVLDRLREICDDGVDLVHCHGARANFIGAALKKKVDIPMVTTIHSDYLLDFDGFYRKLVYTSLNVFALKKFKYFIAVSDNFRQMMISRGFRPDAVYTVYNGMDYSGTPDFVSKEAFAARVGIPYDPACTYVGLIGRHDYVKGHDVFIKAIAKVCAACPHTRFVIAGEGENRAALVELARAEGVEDKLTFVGFVKDIYSFINFIDINTLTSRSESFPYVLMEGARMSKPTVCSAVGGIPDFVMDGKTGLLFPSEDSGALADKLIRLIQNPALAEKYGAALHRLALEKFSDTALADKHMEIYRTVLRDSREKKRYDVVLSGYYGFSNSGDDALLYAILESLRKYVPDVRVCVLSAHAKAMRLQYGVDCEPRFSPVAVYRTLKNTKLLLSGGGSLIQDATSAKSLTYYLTVTRLARRVGAGLYVYANGIGPLHRKNYARAAKVLEQADYITLRDPASLVTLREMGVKNPRCQVTADPALLLSGTPREALDGIFAEENIPADGRFLVISVRQWQANDRAFVKKIAAIADYAAQTYGLIPLFLPMRFPHDTAISKEIASCIKAPAYVLKKPLPVQDMIGLAACAEVVLGMRLHTLIYAAGAAVPVIGVVYDRKIPGFLDYIGQTRQLDASDIDVKKACAYIDEISADRDAVRTALAAQKQRLTELADENARVAVQLLSACDSAAAREVLS